MVKRDVEKNRTVGRGVVMGIFLLSMAFMGCASIIPMDEAAIAKYKLASNTDLFKGYQYYASRDTIFTNVDENTNIGQTSGQARMLTTRDIEVWELLSSTEGEVVEVQETGEKFLLGVSFDPSSDDLMWFAFDFDDGVFYLDYIDKEKGEIEYAGKRYTVSYEEATGVMSKAKRLITSKKSKEEYNQYPVFLLFAENVKVKETEKRRTFGGRKL